MKKNIYEYMNCYKGLCINNPFWGGKRSNLIQTRWL